VFFAFLATHFSNPSMSLLYGDLDPQDSGKIVGKLEAMGVPYELRGDGRQILVPGERALRLRKACRWAARSATRSSIAANRSAPPASSRT
jgi:flagellar biosynthesis/type III secretory pathway M-ring protein FliF/YscJ